ncbi:sigma-70 family RNA polymerase sigma factor [Dongia sp.]|uniref:sigma-70 family RNA polymerase sigma factor n=1 Tax=Dongia sp. TaxID=1977262 RepID=UPI0035B0478B
MADTFQNQIVSFLPALKAFAVMLTRNRVSADDLVNDTVLRALRKHHLYADGTNLKAWLFTIMRNIHINNLRAGQRRRLVEVSDDLLPNLASVAPGQEDVLVLKELFRAFDGLSENQREVLMLVVGQDLSYEETAQICGCPIGTVRSRLARGRRELGRMLDGEVPLPAANDRAVPARAPRPRITSDMRAAS